MTENKIIENENSNISNENLVNLEEVELSNLKPEELIISLDQLIDSNNPFSVSNRVENIKALFYKNFNNLEQNKESETLEKNFKKIYNLFRKNRNEFRKEQEQKEKENLKLKTEISSLDEIKNKNNADKEELKFLRLNLIHGGECRKTLFNDGYKVGTKEYKNCILSRGKKFND